MTTNHIEFLEQIYEKRKMILDTLHFGQASSRKFNYTKVLLVKGKGGTILQ